MKSKNSCYVHNRKMFYQVLTWKDSPDFSANVRGNRNSGNCKRKCWYCSQCCPLSVRKQTVPLTRKKFQQENGTFKTIHQTVSKQNFYSKSNITNCDLSS